MTLGADIRHSIKEGPKFSCNSSPTGHLRIATLISQPACQFCNKGIHMVAMGMNVLSRNIGYVLLIAVSLHVEHNAAFPSLGFAAEAPSSKKNPEFQRHVEARQICCTI